MNSLIHTATNSAIDFGFSLIEKLCGETPEEPFTISTQGNKGKVCVPVTVCLSSIAQTGLGFSFQGDWVNIHYAV